MLRAVTLAMLGIWSMPLWAWGGLGHHVTAAIALRHLNSKTAEEVRDILGREDFLQASTWADGIKKDDGWRQTYGYHFLSVPDHMSYIDSLRGRKSDDHSKGDVMMAILKALSVLREEGSSKEEKNFSLKFLIHYVGDLHQPLHTGRPEDKGGNLVSIQWFGHRENLHHVWDTSIMETAHRQDFKGKTQKERVEWYADYLEQHQAEGGCDPDLEGWLNHIISTRPVAYTGVEGESAEYLRKALPVVEEHLAQAGYHMACLLNSVFADQKSIPLKERDLRTRMNEAVQRSFEDWIGLKPAS